MKYLKFFSVIVLLIFGIKAHCQLQTHYKKEKQAYFDSLDAKIVHLNKKIKEQSNAMDAGVYFTRKELEHIMFIRAFEEFVLNEELEAAKSLTETRIEHSQKKKDDASVEFYNGYMKRWHLEYKSQRLRYQKLFSKEKNFKKEYDFYMKQGTIEAYLKAKRITELAMKYAREQSLTSTLKYLQHYYILIDANIFDLESPYTLEKLTKSDKYFCNIFNPLVSSDSLKHIQEAGEITDQCYFYSSITKSKLDTVYFARKRSIVASAIADYFDMQERVVDLTKITDHAISLRLDTLNPYGVFKWGKYIIVIDNMVPQSTFPNVRRGEAILKADIQLIKYINANKIGKVKPNATMGHTFLIPFFVNNTNEFFLFDKKYNSYQFMVCYTKVVNEVFTKEVIKYLPPIQFIEELEN